MPKIWLAAQTSLHPGGQFFMAGVQPSVNRHDLNLFLYFCKILILIRALSPFSACNFSTVQTIKSNPPFYYSSHATSEHITYCECTICKLKYLKISETHIACLQHCKYNSTKGIQSIHKEQNVEAAAIWEVCWGKNILFQQPVL